MFEIAVEQSQNRVPVTILRLYGSFDTAAPDVFGPITREMLDQGAQDILLDLRGLTFMSSVGIREMMTLYYELHPESSGEDKEQIMEGIRTGDYTAPHLKLLKPSKEVFRVYQLTGLDMVLETFKNEKKALNSF